MAENGIQVEKKLAEEPTKEIEALKKSLKAKNEECEELRKKAIRLELDLSEIKVKGALNANETAEVHKMKEESEELLTKAKSIIFEKVKLCKNQELQIDALNAQITSLKDVVSITKNLLEIRNLEVTHLQDQINCMNGKMAAEKERQDLVYKKLDQMIRMNTDLKREYETQLVLFGALRQRYSERELARDVLQECKQQEAQQQQGKGDVSKANGSNQAEPDEEVKTLVTKEPIDETKKPDAKDEKETQVNVQKVQTKVEATEQIQSLEAKVDAEKEPEIVGPKDESIATNNECKSET